MTDNGFQTPCSSVLVSFLSSIAAKVRASSLARPELSQFSGAWSMPASKSKAPPPRPQCITLGAVLDLRTTAGCEPQRSNTVSVTDTSTSPLRAQCGAAQRER